MKLSKKALALLVGLTVSVSGTAFAAEGADSFSDVPQGHWAYDALDYLAKDGVIDGMGDGTFQGNRTMTRYEMASIVAKAMQKGGLGIGDQAVLDKLAAEYGDEIATLKKQTAQNTKDIKDLKEKTDKFKVWGMARVQAGDDNGLQNDGRNGTYNNRFYMDLEGQMKINDHAVARFTVEKNAHYREKEYANSKLSKIYSLTRADGTNDILAVKDVISNIDKDSILGDDNHNGSISNIWVELQLGPQHNWYTNIGRKWNGIGMQNLMLGGQVDGIQTYHPIEHGHGWWFSGQYWTNSANWTQIDGWPKETFFTADDQAVKDGDKQVGDHKGWDTSSLTVHSRRNPVIGTLNFWGPLGKYIDANLAYSRVLSHDYDTDNGNGYWSKAKNFYGVDLKVRPIKDLAITGSYVKSDAENDWFDGTHADRDLAVRIDYRGTDMNKVGSWGVYAKWVDLGTMADLGHDDEWTTREPVGSNGTKGWYYGFKLVPAKNVEWETLWAPHLVEGLSHAGTYNSRHILRSWLDFHF